MDVLGDVLLSLRLLASRIGILDFGCPWGIAAPPLTAHLVFGMTVLDGPFWFAADGCPLTRLQPGDTALILSGASHSFMSAPGAPLTPFGDFVDAQGLERLGLDNPHADPLEVRWGAGSERTRLLLIALIAQDGGPSAILTKLPRTIILPANPQNRAPWLDAAVAFLAAENRTSPGFTAAATQYVELIFTSLLRDYLLAGDAPGPNWVSGLRDPRVGRAVAGIHTRPGAPWTVERLAREAGMARSTFAKRFVELIGQPPIDYLIAHRMQLAYGRLAADKQPVYLVAESLGYRSERAFRQAFKAHFGLPPTRYVKRQDQNV